jgi:hypothetical protein
VVVDLAVRRYLADLVGAARDVLGDDLVGAYAAGSLALDAYEPGRSDIDVALVAEDRLADEHKRHLVARLRHEVLPCPARGLELVVYRHAAARSGTPDPGFELELNTGAAMTFRATYRWQDRPESDGRFWYGLDRSILHQSGLQLDGPPAAEVFAELAPVDLRELLIDALTWWLARPIGSADDAVLGACRSLAKVRDGVWLSKVAAGRRLADTGLEPALITRCIAARRGGPPPDTAEARTFQRRVLYEIRGLDRMS